jgi:hypothetical protein
MTALFRIAALALLAVLSACSSPLVGAECRSGLTDCDGQCVDLERDPANCGVCSKDCGRLECRKARCGPGPRPDGDGGAFVPDAGSGPPVTPGGVGSPFLPDGGLSFPDPEVDEGCALGSIVCMGKFCKNPRTDPNHCGRCGLICPYNEYCAEGVCVDRCTEPLTYCDETCVPTMSSAEHCGNCGNGCASGICTEGACDDIVPGQLVIFGHDYNVASEASTTMKRLTGNALFLASGAPVRALIYRGAASDRSAEGVEAAIDFTVNLDGRPWSRIEAIEDEVTSQLFSADAFIIHAQDGASDDELTALGRKWGLALSQFLLRGGVVLLFETVTDNNSGTYRLLQPTGLFDAASRRSVARRQTLTVVNPGIGVAARTTRSYRSATNTVRFVGVTSPGTVVVQDSDRETVIFHRIVSQ